MLALFARKFESFCSGFGGRSASQTPLISCLFFIRCIVTDLKSLNLRKIAIKDKKQHKVTLNEVLFSELNI